MNIIIKSIFYKDFILEFEVNVTSGLNSGVQFRSLQSSDSRKFVYGYQLELEANGIITFHLELQKNYLKFMTVLLVT